MAARSPINVRTGRPKRVDSPKSSRTARPSQATYWAASGSWHRVRAHGRPRQPRDRYRRQRAIARRDSRQQHGRRRHDDHQQRRGGNAARHERYKPVHVRSFGPIDGARYCGGGAAPVTAMLSAFHRKWGFCGAGTRFCTRGDAANVTTGTTKYRAGTSSPKTRWTSTNRRCRSGSEDAVACCCINSSIRRSQAVAGVDLRGIPEMEGAGADPEIEVHRRIRGARIEPVEHAVVVGLRASAGRSSAYPGRRCRCRCQWRRVVPEGPSAARSRSALPCRTSDRESHRRSRRRHRAAVAIRDRVRPMAASSCRALAGSCGYAGADVEYHDRLRGVTGPYTGSRRAKVDRVRDGLAIDAV